MYISPDISDTPLWLIVAAFVCAMMLFAIYFFRIRTVAVCRRRADSERPDKADAEYLPVSVVIFSQGDADTLEALLRQVLGQDYPAAFEIIVVNEGESADVRDTVAMLRSKHSNLYLTFTPEGVVNLSRKKLALTLGVKAARYDIVALTTTAAEIESPLWLRRMMTPFDRDGRIEVALGFSYVEPDEDREFGFRGRAFDYVAESTRWLGAAIAGKPFRGTEYNIAYRREAFLRNKGFARSLNLCYGDDDIFISEIARPENTVVELADESIVRLRHGNHPRIFLERTLRRMFTESHIRRRPRILFELTGWLQIVILALCAVAAIVAYPNMLVTIVAVAMILLIAAMDIYFWRRNMAALKSRRMFLTLPWYSATYPLRRFAKRLRAPFAKQKKYTWD